jgi:hypothetical protein
MRSRWLRGSVAAASLVAGVIASLLVADPAMASPPWPIDHTVGVEKNTGVKVPAPSERGKVCWHYVNYGLACYQRNGDYWFVKNEVGGGKVVAAIWEDYYYTSSTQEHLRRRGICRNTYGKGTWVRCNKNYHEGDWLQFTVGVVKKDTNWTVTSNMFLDWRNAKA